jgi:hypothetical protein
MLNPWFALSVHAVRFGLEAQKSVMAGFFGSAEVPKDSATETSPLQAQLLPESAKFAPAEMVANNTAVHVAKKIHKRTRGKHRARR